MNTCRENSTSSCDTESNSKCSSSCFGAEQRVGQYSQESRTRRVRVVPENAVDCPGLLLEAEYSSYVAVRVKKWPQSAKHGMANFFVCAAIVISEVGAGAQFKLRD